MKARVHVFFKQSIFDPQGNTLCESLKRLGFSKVSQVRMGKVMDIEMGDVTVGQAEADVRRMCEKLLYNPVIEFYSIEIEKP